MKRAERKRAVKEEIHIAALNEFFEHNYKEASMRTIAKNVNMTVGNLYCYFNNKADIFDSLVGEIYEQATEYFNKTAQLVIRTSNFTDESVIDVIRQGSIIMEEKRKNLIILMNRGAGTKYANVKSEFTGNIQKHYLAIVDSFEKAKGTKFGGDRDFMTHMAAYFFIEGFVDIVMNFRDRRNAEKSLIELIELLAGGLNGFFR